MNVWRHKGKLCASLFFGALAAWALWPEQSGPAGPSITERAQKHEAEPASLSAKVIPGEDLPPAGTRSLFDHLIAQNEVLPQPFEKLVALIQSQDPEGKPPVALMIPRGRSLLKAQADFDQPRVLVAADYQAPDSATALGFAPRGRLFLGFVEAAGEIEVISYNEAAGRYEFQLVQDYRVGGVPRIVYARRAICTTCHQGAAPIFPQRPWSETNGQPEIASRIAEARGGAAPYMGVPLSVPLSVPERFDELTDVANFLPVAQRIWLDACGEGAQGQACRRQLLKVALEFALDPGGFSAQGKGAAALRALQEKSWPGGGVPIAESDLRNRDPLAESRGLRGYLRTLFTPKSTEPGAKSNEDLAAFDRLPKLPAELDPVSSRPPKRVLAAADLDGAFGLAQFFTPADLKLLDSAAGFEAARLISAVDRVPAAFFEPAPFSRTASVNALLVALRAKARSYAFLDTSEMSPPQALGVPPLMLSENSVLKPFARFCFGCHRGNPAKRLDFMSGKDEAEVLEHVKGKGEIRDVLDWPRYKGSEKESSLMPPADSHQRHELEAALASDPQLLEEMRKVVPALFEF